MHERVVWLEQPFLPIGPLRDCENVSCKDEHGIACFFPSEKHALLLDTLFLLPLYSPRDAQSVTAIEPHSHQHAPRSSMGREGGSREILIIGC